MKTIDPTPPTHFRARRETLLQHLERGLLILPTAPERVRNRDTHHPFRADSYFWYLSGFPEPEAVVVLIAGQGDTPPRHLLFCRDKNEEREVWEGYRYGPEAAREVFAFDATYSIDELDQRLPELLADQPILWHPLGLDAAWDNRVIAALNQVRAQARAGRQAPGEIRDPRQWLDAMRRNKGPEELSLMQRAADVATRAHERAMARCRPGMAEYALEAEFLHAFREAGGVPSYPTIVAGGAHACVLHYVENDSPLRAGDLVLIDAGCEIEGYASDITRTFPVSGRFSAAQKTVYEIVLAAQEAAIAAVTPGACFDDPHTAALKVLVQGLMDLKLLPGSLDGNLESGAYKRFYMHRTSHWLGLDVHDAGDYREPGGGSARLTPGMVLTIEPGLYLRPGEGVPESLAGIGIRIEDDVLVTASGQQVLTSPAKSVAAIEALMNPA